MSQEASKLGLAGAPPPPYGRTLVDVTGASQPNRKIRRHLARVARARARRVAARERLIRTSKDCCDLEQDVDKWKHAVEDSGRYGPPPHREIPHAVKWIVAGAATIGFFVVDKTLLLGLGGSVLTTKFLAATAAVASESCALWFGAGQKAWDTALVPDEQVHGLTRMGKKWGAKLGIGIEVALGVLRAILLAAPLTSALLALAGVAIWCVSSWTTYRASHPLLDQRDRAERRLRRRQRYLHHDFVTDEKRAVKYGNERLGLKAEAARKAAEVERRIIGVKSLVETYGKEPAPEFPEVIGLRDLKLLADGHVPEHLDTAEVPPVPICGQANVSIVASPPGALPAARTFG